MKNRGVIAIIVLSALFSVVFGLEQVTYAATINAASCSSTHVQNAINAAADGDRVLVPAGTCTWTSRVTVSGKGITLAGAGVGQTTIVNGTNSTALQFDFTPGNPTTYVEGFTFDANNVSGADAMILAHWRWTESVPDAPLLHDQPASIAALKWSWTVWKSVA